MIMLAYVASGAVLTVGVAWGIAAWLPAPSYAGGWRGQSVPVSMHMVPSSWPLCVRAEQGRAWGRTETQAYYGTEGPHYYSGAEHMLVHMQTGWPMRAMESWMTLDMPAGAPWQSKNHFGFRIGDLAPRGRPYPERPFRRIPLRPDMPGFAVNTVTYALVLFAAARLVTWARGALRRRRGQCARCGYDIAGLAMCPECGSPSGSPADQQRNKGASSEQGVEART
jgi:hypothetical protein